MTWSATAVVLPVIAWAFLLTRLSGERRGFLTHLGSAACLGLGTSTVVWWALMLLPLTSRTWLIAIDATFWTLACLVAWRVAQSVVSRPEDDQRRRAAQWPPKALLIVALTAAGVYFVAAAATIPHGTWDAWAIWNARARFFFRGYPGAWMEAFSPALSWSHPDYPLLVPLSVARAWTYIGGEHVTVPILLGATFCTGIVTTAAISVRRTATGWRGVLTAVMILASPVFLAYGATQCADIPLAFYVLTTCVLVGRATEAGSRPAWWAVAGVAAGLAAWTKNEGMFFAAIVFVVCAAWSYRSNRWRGLARIAPLLGGAAPILAALVIFKLFFAPPNDLMAAQSIGHVLSNLGNVDRLQIVAAAVGKELWFGGANLVGVLPILAMFVLATGITRPVPPGPMLGLGISAAVIAADILVYILTPQDLVWHLSTSVQRVVLQIFPVLVWCGMSLAGERRGALSADGRARVRAEGPGLAASTPGF